MSKPTGLDWAAIEERYVAAGGKTAGARQPQSSPTRPRPAIRIPDARPNGLKVELSRDKTNELVTRYAGGEAATVLGKALGISQQTVIRLLREQGVEIRPRRARTALEPEVLAQVIERYEQKFESVTTLAAELGIGNGTLIRILKENNVRLRSKAESTRVAKMDRSL